MSECCRSRQELPLAACSNVDTDTTVAEQLGEPLGSDLSSLLPDCNRNSGLLNSDCSTPGDVSDRFLAQSGIVKCKFQTVGYIWQIE